jgi:hypothetical protein
LTGIASRRWRLRGFGRWNCAASAVQLHSHEASRLFQTDPCQSERYDYGSRSPRRTRKWRRLGSPCTKTTRSDRNKQWSTLGVPIAMNVGVHRRDAAPQPAQAHPQQVGAHDGPGQGAEGERTRGDQHKAGNSFGGKANSDTIIRTTAVNSSNPFRNAIT